VEVTRLLSNLIKSGFVAFSQDDTLVIDANKNKIIEQIDDTVKKQEMLEQSEEEALAAALIRDVGLDSDLNVTGELDVDEELLSFRELSEEEQQQKVDDILAQAKRDAEEIVNKAHEEAEQMRAAAFDEIQTLKQQAKEEGHQEGFSEGSQQASEEYEKKKAQLEEQVSQNEMHLQEREEQLVLESSNKMAELLCQLVPKLVGVSIENEKDVLLHLINRAMHNLDDSNRFVIRVSGQDYAELVSRKEEIYGALNPSVKLEIFEDAKLSSLQCQIETDNGLVDVSLDAQLDNLTKSLKLLIQE
jgi:flagellar assembly protein FliH